MGSLPEQIAPLTLENIYYFFIYQSHGIIEYDGQDWFLQYIPGGAVFKKTGLGPSHTGDVATLFHEYGHQIDGLSYGYLSPHVGMINTLGFYEMFFDMEDTKDGYFGIYARYLDNPLFVSAYADGWEHPDYPGYYTVYEAFAEAFALYIVNGRLFREFATIDYDYERQYDWLKTNVFGGTEYATGSEDSISNDSPLWDYNSGLLPPGIHDVLEYGHVYDSTSYENPVFSLSRHVEILTGSPTCPVITEIKPQRRFPKERIKIFGSGFGHTQGDSIVKIGPKTFDKDSPRIKKWTDTLIRIKIPNFKCEWFKGKNRRPRKVQILVPGCLPSNTMKFKVKKPDTCP